MLVNAQASAAMGSPPATGWNHAVPETGEHHGGSLFPDCRRRQHKTSRVSRACLQILVPNECARYQGCLEPRRVDV